MIFEGFDEIDWSGLEHAYGTADDVPGLLRQIAREGTGGGLADPSNELFHQGGSVCSALRRRCWQLEWFLHRRYGAHLIRVAGIGYLFRHLQLSPATQLHDRGADRLRENFTFGTGRSPVDGAGSCWESGTRSRVLSEVVPPVGRVPIGRRWW